jgi:hypothetical protein
MNDIRVSSWNDLHDCLYAGAWKEELGRFRSNHAYRGMPDATYDLQTSLSRLSSAAPSLEQHLLRTFRRYAPRYITIGDSVWNWQAVAQHHGLPTRLLDWTYSPYVALHFATATPAQMDIDGIVWAVDFTQTNTFLPDALNELLHEQGANVFTAEMLHEATPTLAAFDALADAPFVAFFEPPSLDDRIVNQFALFALMSGACSRLDHWLAEHPDTCYRVIIPADLKWEVRDKLDQANITERVLFPGLDGLSRWLTRYYTPRERDDWVKG